MLADALLAGARPRLATRSPTGRSPATSAGTTSSTGARATTSAFGCAAHSHQAGRRWWNVRTPERYLALVEAGASAEGGCEELDAEAQRMEALQLALRTVRGVPAAALDVDGLDGLVRGDGARRRAHTRGPPAGQRAVDPAALTRRPDGPTPRQPASGRSLTAAASQPASAAEFAVEGRRIQSAARLALR